MKIAQDKVALKDVVAFDRTFQETHMVYSFNFCTEEAQ